MADSRKNFTLSPLGGLGEIGLNCMVLECGDSMIMIDCGIMFPEDYLFGIDIVIPRFDFVLARKDKLKGIIITHGHEDHIGALPWLLPYVDAPIYSSRFTLALIESRLREHDLDRYVDLRPVEGRQRVDFGDIAVNFFRVCHSIIEGFGLGIETPTGRIVHTGDFKIDRTPLDDTNVTDLEGFAEFSAPGVQLMLSDSTNVERDGYALTEREIKQSLSDIFAKATGRILVTLFSSHIQRMQEIIDLAETYGRKVAISGRSIQNNIDLSRNLGYLRASESIFVPMDSVSNYPDDQIVLLLTGSQGEPLSSLTRLAMSEHRQMRIKEGDLVLMSSRFIPGNTRAITKVINRLYKLGAEVLYERVSGIHASGHAHREELCQMLRTVKPKFFVPVHGEYRHLVKHSRLAVECGVAKERSLILEDGQPLRLFEDNTMRLLDHITVEHIYVDGKGVGDVGSSVLKERQLLAGEGLVIVNLVIDEKSGEIALGPEITSKGFVFEQHYAHLLEDAKCIVLDIFENIPPGEIQKLKDRIRGSLRRFFRKVLDRDPVVIPVVISL
ncbi:putative hydrolase of the metallo-beta-lactamase superfamily [Desulfocurvibacter africanus PCS]|uniref:Ribonuclease J n=1 Tax=Desulfocurvibacter africanus PCS TaxID=1262666 RepID=M5Q347_DESAF|nr:ribonuclease J [Desulfocurvibacter africanus]EMG39036.1 putative hydrolase of the metallo-beta-lactamase superfamily [Desulfocurvibacter africanus PCS]